MRFSSAFHHPAPQREVRPAEEPVPEIPRPAATRPAPELPDDLDARVRLVGEWQLLEG